MISIKDYDANYHIDPKTVRKLKNMSGILTNKLSSVPIFFVKRETIDRHCRGICLSTECTDDLFNSGEFDRYHQDFFEKEIRNIRIRDFGYVFPNEENVNRLFEKLKGCVMMCDAIGCYISNSG